MVPLDAGSLRSFWSAAVREIKLKTAPHSIAVGLFSLNKAMVLLQRRWLWQEDM